MCALPDGDGGESAGDEIGDVGVFRQDDGEGAGPEGGGELVDGFLDFRGDDGDALEIAAAGDVDDEWVEGGAFLGGEDFCDGFRIEGVRGEAVDGFGGEGDDFSGTQEVAGSCDGLFHFIIGGMDDSGVWHAGRLPEGRRGWPCLIFEFLRRHGNR